ncbi:hypothetical protein EJB05_16116, partial [Eragrostis curvula]
MEARQFRRYAEGRADHEREVQEELATLNDLAASYHSRLRSHGIDPNSFSDEDEEEGEEILQQMNRHRKKNGFLCNPVIFRLCKGGEILSRHFAIWRMLFTDLKPEVCGLWTLCCTKDVHYPMKTTLDKIIEFSDFQNGNSTWSIKHGLSLVDYGEKTKGRTKDRFCGGSSEKPNPSHNNNINLSPNLVVVHHNLFALVLAAVIHRWKVLICPVGHTWCGGEDNSI